MADPGCVIPGVENCANGLDDDGDTLIDCADSNCNGSSCGNGCQCAGGARTEINCTDGLDNDGDGAIDCADLNCSGNPACTGAENCTDGIDNDGDGWIDCVDAACQSHPACIIYASSCGAIPTGNTCLVGAGHTCAIGVCAEWDFCVCSP